MNYKIYFLNGLLGLSIHIVAMEIKKEIEYYPYEGNALIINTPIFFDNELKINTKKLLNLELYDLDKKEKEKIITISFNGGLRKIPIKPILSFNNLLHLKLIGTHIKTLPLEIEHLKKLRVLNISRNKISELPKTIGNLINLEYLYLHHNKLYVLPREIKNLTKLKCLWVQNNQLRFIPKEIGYLTNLENLNIEENEVTFLPTTIKNLTKLKYLEASNNKITNVKKGIPREIEYLSNLISLYLCNNRLLCLKNLIESTQHLTKLVVLDIRGNNLHCQPKKCPCLKSLYQITKKRKISDKNYRIIQLDKKQCDKIKKANNSEK